MVISSSSSILSGTGGDGIGMLTGGRCQTSRGCLKGRDLGHRDLPAWSPAWSLSVSPSPGQTPGEELSVGEEVLKISRMKTFPFLLK